MTDKTPTVAMDMLLIDCRDMAPFLQDLAPGELKGIKGTQEGYDEVVAEILSNQRMCGELIGITHRDIEELTLANQRVATLDACLPTLRKLLEIMEETRIKIDGERHRRVCEIAALVDVRSKASRDSSLLARYEKTRTYRSAPGVKAARTRRKNREAAATLAKQETPRSGT